MPSFEAKRPESGSTVQMIARSADTSIDVIWPMPAIFMSILSTITFTPELITITRRLLFGSLGSAEIESALNPALPRGKTRNLRPASPGGVAIGSSLPGKTGWPGIPGGPGMVDGPGMLFVGGGGPTGTSGPVGWTNCAGRTSVRVGASELIGRRRSMPRW